MYCRAAILALVLIGTALGQGLEASPGPPRFDEIRGVLAQRAAEFEGEAGRSARKARRRLERVARMLSKDVGGDEEQARVAGRAVKVLHRGFGKEAWFDEPFERIVLSLSDGVAGRRRAIELGSVELPSDIARAEIAGLLETAGELGQPIRKDESLRSTLKRMRDAVRTVNTAEVALRSAGGEPAAAGSRAIARWDVVPFQEFTGTFPVGVVAFHLGGIERVDFSVNGGPWIPVPRRARNPRTGVWEYFITLDAALHPDGPVEVRAVAYPVVGAPRRLEGPTSRSAFRLGEHSMVLYANSGDTLPHPTRWADSVNGSDTTGDGSQEKPFATLVFALRDIQKDVGIDAVGACDGARVLLRPGSYVWGPAQWPNPSAPNRWVTVEPAAGVDPADVVVAAKGSNGLQSELVRAHRLTVRETGQFLPGSGERHLWIDSCDMVGPGRAAGVSPFRGSGWAGVFLTDTTIASYHDAVSGATLARNVRAFDLGSDAYTNTRMVLDCTVDGIDASGTSNHPDVYTLFDADVPIENVIVYGLRATNANCQGIFAASTPRISNVAFVNVLMAMPHGSTSVSSSQWSVPGEHLLFSGVTVANQSFAWRTSGLSDLWVTGCLFDKMNLGKGGDGETVSIPQAGFTMNHFVDTESFGAAAFGTHFTTGDPLLVDPAAGEFAPSGQSPLVNRLPAPVDPVDAAGNPRKSPDAVGALTR